MNLIIIPTFNEVMNVIPMLESLRKLYPEIHILIVDDFSPDKTYEAVEKFKAQDDKVHLIVKKVRTGLGGAYLAGFNWAFESDYKFKTITSLDCDFSHPIEKISEMISQLKDFDFVIGSRYVGQKVRVINWPMKRLILSKMGSLYTRVITGMPIMDPTAGFNTYKVSWLRKVPLNSILSNGYSFQIEIKYRLYCLGGKYLEVPIYFTERENGKSKMSKQIVYEAIISVIVLRVKRLFGLI
jgi:dolichol-phosphate mannosyltransferase